VHLRDIKREIADGLVPEVDQLRLYPGGVRVSETPLGQRLAACHTGVLIQAIAGAEVIFFQQFI